MCILIKKATVYTLEVIARLKMLRNQPNVSGSQISAALTMLKVKHLLFASTAIRTIVGSHY